MSDKIVYLMRGLPSCGKSTTARKLAGETGVICETDEYFYTQVGDDPTKFDYREELMEDARRWNFERFQRAIDNGVSPIIVDRGNSRSIESKTYAKYAIDHGYRVEMREPESEWWQEIRVLLKHKRLTKPALYEWAERLAAMNRDTHRTPVATIRRWMDKWKWDLTVEDILNFEPRPKPELQPAAQEREPDSQVDGPTEQTPEHSTTRAEPQGAPIDDLAPLQADESASTAQDFVPDEEDVLLQDSPLKPGERSPFL